MLLDCWVLSIKDEKDLIGGSAIEFWWNFDFSLSSQLLGFFFCIISNSFGILKFSLLISAICFALRNWFVYSKPVTPHLNPGIVQLSQCVWMLD